MIKTNELRVGNYVAWNGQYFIFQALLNDKIYLYPPDHELMLEAAIDEIQPIPLNLERLKELGFLQADENYLKKEVYFGAYIHALKFDSDWGFSFLFGPFFYIDYLHQLQNLYYAFSDQELNVRSTSTPTVSTKSKSLVGLEL